MLMEQPTIPSDAPQAFPSTSALTIWARFAVLSSLFMTREIMRERSRICQQQSLI